MIKWNFEQDYESARSRQERGNSRSKRMLVGEFTVMNLEQCKQLVFVRTLSTRGQPQDVGLEKNPEGFLEELALEMSPGEQVGL